VCKPEADPEDTQQGGRDREGHVTAQRADERQHRRQPHSPNGGEHYLELVPVGRRDDQGGEADEARQRQRPHGRQQPVQLVQRDETETHQEHGEQRAPTVEDDREGDHDPGKRDEHACARGVSGAPAPAGWRRASPGAAFLRH
jgi:hypothetical protein